MRNYLYSALAVLLFGLGAYVDRLYMNGKLSQEVTNHSQTKEDFKESIRLAEKRSDFLSINYQEQLNAASKIAKQETAEAKASLVSAIAANNSLHKTISTLNASVAKATRAAVEEYATVSGQLLTTCTKRLVWYAEQADGYRIDANELSNAWPKNPD